MPRNPHVPPARRERALIRLGPQRDRIGEVDEPPLQKTPGESTRGAERGDGPDVLHLGIGGRGGRGGVEEVEVGTTAIEHLVAEDGVCFEPL